MLLPGIGEMFVSERIRLSIALVTTLVVTPVVQNVIPAYPESVFALFLLLIREVLVGLAIGLSARIILSSTHVAGMIIAFQSGLATATLFDPSQGSQGSIFGNFLSLSALLLFFSLNLHHLIIYGFAESYSLFSPAAPLPIEDFSELISKLASDSFAVGIKIAAPQLVIGLLLFLASGVLARLMPNMQIFFVIIPLQIIVSFVVLLLTFAASIVWYMDYFEESMGDFLFPGENVTIEER